MTPQPTMANTSTHARRWLLLWLGLAPACRSTADPPLPAVVVQGEFIDYAADADVCPGTVTFAEDFVRTVATSLLIDPTELGPITYYWLDVGELVEICVGARACAAPSDGGIAVYSKQLVDRHELVHAIHLSVWGRRPPLLAEGLATLFDDEFSQRYDSSLDAATIAELIEVEDARDDNRVYAGGAILSYWILARHGPEGLTQLWDRIGDGPITSASFEALFLDIFDETLAEMFAAIDGETACQVVSCFGESRPWDGQQWSTRSPEGCEDGAVGLTNMDFVSYFGTDLVEIAVPGVYILSTEAGGAAMSTCGASCTQLGSGDFGAAQVFAGEPIEVVLPPGTYRIETYSSALHAGYEVVLEPVE